MGMLEGVNALKVRDIVDIACDECNIHLPLMPNMPHDLPDEQIAEICRWIGRNAPDCMIIDNEQVIGTIGWDTMMFITLTEFPDFFVRNQLYMVWRN